MPGIDQPTAGLSPRNHWFGISGPIGMFGAYLAIVEVALILGIIFADGNIRWAMLILAAAIFFFTAGAFLWILWSKNWVLYPPKDYASSDDYMRFVQAMGQFREPFPDTAKILELIRATVSESLTSPQTTQDLLEALPIGSQGSERAEAEQAIVRKLDQAVDRAVVTLVLTNIITLTTGDFLPTEMEFSAFFDPQMTVGRFLYGALEQFRQRDPHQGEYLEQFIRHVPGDRWALEDQKSGKVFRVSGQDFGCSLEQFGLKPGMRLSFTYLPIESETPSD